MRRLSVPAKPQACDEAVSKASLDRPEIWRFSIVSLIKK
jgi:hypothetical protein